MHTAMLVAIIVVAAVLFVTEAYSVDVVAVLIMISLMVTGLVSVNEGVSGFSSNATITVAAFFVITTAIRNTGALALLGERLTAMAENRPRRLLAIVIAMAGASSSFLHATGVVAIYMPVVISAARQVRESASRYLIPLSYAAQFGGVCTLLGTTSNLVVSGIMVGRGMAPVGMFEITRLGLILFALGLTYLLFVGWHIIPSRRQNLALETEYGLDQYLTELSVAPHSPIVGRTLAEADLRNAAGIDVLVIQRGEERTENPRARHRIRSGDVLLCKVTLGDMINAYGRLGLQLPPELQFSVTRDGRPVQSSVRLIEIQVAPNADVVGRSVRESRFGERFDVSVLGMKRPGRTSTADLRDEPIRANDTLLVQGSRRALSRLQNNDRFLILSNVATPSIRKRRLVVLILLLAGIVVCTAAHMVPIELSTTVAAGIVLGGRVMSAEEAYRSMNWKVIFLIAGMVPLGIALDKWGVAASVAGAVQHLVGNRPWMLLSLVYLMTMLVTEFVTHVACAMLMAPIAISVALTCGLDPRPFCIAVIFAADTSFSTPVGYQTNAMVFGPGGYRFIDYTRVGLPLNLLFWLTSSWLIPLWWPLHHP